MNVNVTSQAHCEGCDQLDKKNNNNNKWWSFETWGVHDGEAHNVCEQTHTQNKQAIKRVVYDGDALNKLNDSMVFHTSKTSELSEEQCVL